MSNKSNSYRNFKHYGYIERKKKNKTNRILSKPDNRDWKEIFHELFWKSETYEKAKTLLNKHKPKFLYKFLTLERNNSNISYALENLKNNNLTFQSPLNFNDPYDSLANVDSQKQFQYFEDSLQLENTIFESCCDLLDDKFKLENNRQYNAQYRKIQVAKNQFEEKTLLILTKFLRNFRICCFSETKDSILMWSHYANYHKGICISYNFEELQNNFKSKNFFELYYKKHDFNELFPVYYTKNFPKIDASNTLKTLTQAIFTKYKDWEYEKEWRILKYNSSFNGKPINDTSTLIKVPTPNAIYMGCKINLKDKKELISICEKEKISLYLMHMSPSNYILKPEPIILIIDNKYFKHTNYQLNKALVDNLSIMKNYLDKYSFYSQNIY